MVVEDVDIESLVTVRSAETEDMEPGEYEGYVKTQIAKAMGFKEDTTNKAELSLVDSYYEVQLAALGCILGPIILLTIR